jgi:Na+-translocating ferredoxin:NAD+ oxidoreductase subunit B
MKIIILMGVIGAIFGFVLAFANKKFSVEQNPIIHMVDEILPKGQCGACGFAGCQAYAEAVVLDKDVPPDLCIPGKSEVAKKVADITGKKSKQIEKRIACVSCANPIGIAQKKFEYSGIDDCIAASILHLGPKDCQYGCIGFGTCVKHCPFGAIKLSEKGLPVVDKNRCTGCGKCEIICPKKIIHMIDVNSLVEVLCSSKDKGATAKKHCDVACIGCGICKKSCSYNAVKIENNIAVIEHSVCKEKCNEKSCLDKCPTGAIKARI